MLDSSKEEQPKSILERLFYTVWCSIIVGIAYTFTIFFLGGFLTKMGIPFPDMTSLGMSKLWFLGASVLMGFVLGGISQIVHTSKLNHMMCWTILLFLNPFSVTLESAFLAPKLLSPQVLPALMLVQFIAALITAVLITLLFASSSKQAFGSYFHRIWASWGLRITLSIGFALLLYSLFGAIDYQSIPALYYESYQIKIPLPGIEVILAIQFARAILIVLSLIPMIITIGATKRFIAVICGLTLLVLGCLSPFLQVSNFSMFLLLASSGKIFIQNFLIGLFVGFILGYPSKLEAEGISIIEYLRPILREMLHDIALFLKKIFKFFQFKKPAAIPEDNQATEPDKTEAPTDKDSRFPEFRKNGNENENETETG